MLEKNTAAHLSCPPRIEVPVMYWFKKSLLQADKVWKKYHPSLKIPACLRLQGHPTDSSVVRTDSI